MVIIRTPLSLQKANECCITNGSLKDIQIERPKRHQKVSKFAGMRHRSGVEREMYFFGKPMEVSAQASDPGGLEKIFAGTEHQTWLRGDFRPKNACCSARTLTCADSQFFFSFQT
jgi:hypothetical protein